MRYVPLPIGALAFLLGTVIESNVLRGAALIVCGLAIPIAFMNGAGERLRTWSRNTRAWRALRPVESGEPREEATPSPVAPARDRATAGNMTQFMQAAPLCDTEELREISWNREG